MPCGVWTPILTKKVDFAKIHRRPLSKNILSVAAGNDSTFSYMLKVNKRKFSSHLTGRSSCTQEKSITCYITSYARSFFLQTRWMEHVQFIFIYIAIYIQSMCIPITNSILFAGASEDVLKYSENVWILMETRYIPRTFLLYSGEFN